MISHGQVLSKTIHLTLPHNFISTCFNNYLLFNTGQRKNHISYLLSSLWRQHHHSTSLTTTDPSLHDWSSRLLALADPVEIVRTTGASGVLPTLLRFCSRVSRAAAEAGAAALRRRPARLARLARTRSLPIRRPTGSQAGGCSCKGKGWKTESVMIWMNALIYLEYAAGTLSGKRIDAQSMYSVQTAAELFYKGWSLYEPALLKTADYILSTYKVHTEFILSMYEYILRSKFVHTNLGKSTYSRHVSMKKLDHQITSTMITWNQDCPPWPAGSPRWHQGLATAATESSCWTQTGKGVKTVTQEYRSSKRVEDQEAGPIGGAGTWPVRPAAPGRAYSTLYRPNLWYWGENVDLLISWYCTDILLQEAIEANEWHHIHDRHYQIITLISCVYTISYTYIIYDIVFDIDKIIDIEFVHSISRGLNRYQIVNIDIKAITSKSKLQLGFPRAYCGVHTLIIYQRINILYRISFNIKRWIFDIKQESLISNLLNRYRGA